jgi:hypothetical protein
VTSSHTPPRLAPRWPLAVALSLSLFLHAGFGILVATIFTAPPLNIEFQLPMDVEFGASEQMALAPSVASPPAAAGSAPESPPAKPGIASDAGPPPEETPKPKAKLKPDTGDAGAEQPEAAPPGATDKETRIPAGAQIAVRVDMARIRVSPLAEDVRQLLAAIPDWKALLEGSGIDPIEKLDRFMIATPNLQRSKIVVAGRYLGGEQTVLDAVEKLASAQGASSNWHNQAGVRVANWANPDETLRVIALVGPAHFAICREEDLTRVLAFAATRAQAQSTKRARPAQEPPKEHPADALLSMEADEGLSVEVEGAEQFVRRAARVVPAKLRLSAVELPGPRVELRGRLMFSDAEKAAAGADFWDNLRTAYSRNALVSMLGLAEPLKQGTIVHEGTEVTLAVGLTLEQTRLILGYLRELVRPAPSASTNVTPVPPPAPTTP